MNSESRIQNGDRGNREDGTLAEGTVRLEPWARAQNVSFTSVKPETRVQNPSRAFRIVNSESRIQNSEARNPYAEPFEGENSESCIQNRSLGIANSER